MKSSNIGGQAVLEGIMMKHKDEYAVAVRKPDGEILVNRDTYKSIVHRWKKLTEIPFIRGVFNFIDSMVLGMKTLTYSASFFEDDEDSEPGRFELLLDRIFGEKLEKVLMAFVMVMYTLVVYPNLCVVASGSQPAPPCNGTCGFPQRRRSL